MLFAAKKLKGSILVATDGEFGMVEELYFDDEQWGVRYLVVETGNYFKRKNVLISPIGIQSLDLDGKKIWVQMTKQQIEEAPDIETHHPISRQKENIYFNYFNWPPYWTAPGLWALGPYGLPWDSDLVRFQDGLGQTGDIPPYIAKELAEAKQENLENQNTEDSHLRSSDDVIGYRIEAEDARFGHVVDHLIDDQSWSIRYLVIDTVNWWPSKHVLISPEWTQSIDWIDESVSVKLSKEKIQSAPEYTHDILELDPEYETKLLQHYNWPPLVNRNRRREDHIQL